MTGRKEANAVDILIFSKDRACQLHLLLSQLSKNVKGIGRVTITIQTSSDEFAAGYSILRERVAKDDVFQTLRENAEIVYHERDSMSGVFNALDYLGQSPYIMPLADDEIFHRKYDLKNAPASQYFFNNSSVLACAVRLGKNITPAVPKSHRKALYLKAQPDFKEENDFLVWTWPDNLNVCHWSSITSLTGHIYRKEIFNEWFSRYGKTNFLEVEGKAGQSLMECIYKVPQFINDLIYRADWLQQKVLKKAFGVYEQDMLRCFLSKILFRYSALRRSEIPVYLVAPKEGVTASLDFYSNQKGLQGITPVIISAEVFNQHYLRGNVISPESIESMIVDEPLIHNSEQLKLIRFTKYANNSKQIA